MAGNSFDITVKPLALALSRLMFRRVEVAGENNIPKQGSILVIANHENNLVDPMLLFAFAGLRLRFLAKHTLFVHPLVRPLVKLANALPVYRPEDGGDSRRNAEMIDRCARTLLAGDVIGLFPEGRCHNEPAPLPLKMGAARIAIAAARLEPARPVFVLPIGLYYTAKSRFRSSAAVMIGEPIRVAANETPNSLTRTMADSLRRVTLNAPSWGHMRCARRQAELLTNGRPVAPGPLERRERHAAALASLAEVGDRERRDEGSPIESWDNLPEAAPNIGRALLLTLPAMPGLVLGAAPLAVVMLLSRESGHTADEPATRRLMAGLIFAPPIVAAQSLLIGWMAGSLAGLAALLVAPFALYATLLCADSWRDVWRGANPHHS